MRISDWSSDVCSSDLSVSANAVDEAVAHYQAAASDTERLKAESRLRRTLQPPRLRLLTQFNALPEGVKFLVDLRADLLALRGDDPYLQGLDNDLRELLLSWFDTGFLDLRAIDWNSPASLRSDEHTSELQELMRISYAVFCFKKKTHII